MTETPPESPALRLLYREHRDAIARLDPAQVRAVARLAQVARDTSDRTDAELLWHFMRGEAEAPVSHIHPYIPEWWIGHDTERRSLA